MMNRRGGVGAGRVRRSAIEALERRVLLSSAIAAFGAQQAFSVGAVPRSTTVADVNRDGKADLLVVNRDSGTVSVLLGNGNGTFAAQRTSPGGTKPYSLAVADVNGDGKPDLLTASYVVGFHRLSVLLGNGDGTFHSPVNFAAGNGVYTVVSADFNGDGKADAAVSNYSDNTVSVLLGNGNGTFSAPSPQPVGAHPSGLATADVNGDGKADLVNTNYTDGTISILLGNGNGTFQPHADLPAGPNPNALAIGDINGDGKLDIAVADFATAGQIDLLLGNGNGTFLPAQALGVASEPSAVTIADINRDGKMDLAVASFGLSEAAVFLGNGDGTFQAQKLFATGTFPDSVAVADLNSDGRPDLALANMNGSTVSVLLGDVPPVVTSINRLLPLGPNDVDSSVTYSVTFNEPVTGVDASDFVAVPGQYVSVTKPLVVTGFGAMYQVKIDGIAITGYSSLGLNLVDDGTIKDAAGNPLQPGMAFLPSQFPALQFLGLASEAGDFNGDGRQDLLAIGANRTTIGIWLGNGDGTFGAGEYMSVTKAIKFISMADVNGDGRPDLCADYGNRTVGVFLGNGDATFAPAVTFADFPTTTYGFTAADVNGDGAPDLITGHRGNLRIFLGNRDGTFKPAVTASARYNPYQFAVGDLNGDGKPDLAVADSYGGELDVLIGNGDGTFGNPTSLAFTGLPTAVAVGDLNGDGHLDIVTTKSSTGGLSLLLGNADGTFAPITGVTAQVGIQSITLADVNSDGAPDVIAGISSGPVVGVFLNNRNGGFVSLQTYASNTPLSAAAVAVADFNGDGHPDVVEFGNGGNGTTALLISPPDGQFIGQEYSVDLPHAFATLPASTNSIRLSRDVDGTDIDWQVLTATLPMPIDFPAGLTITGNGNNDVVTLDYTNGNPLPNNLHLNGNFTITGLQGANPFAGSNIDIGKSTVYFSYAPGYSLLTVIQQALAAGFNGGAWNGTSANGVIVSAAAAGNASHNTGIGWADSASDPTINTTRNSAELKYTLYGDTNLDGTVDIFDLNPLLAHYNKPGSWTGGDSNYDGQVDVFDLNPLLANYNHSLPAVSSSAIAAIGANAPASLSQAPQDLLNAPQASLISPVVQTADSLTDQGHADDAMHGGIFSKRRRRK